MSDDEKRRTVDVMLMMDGKLLTVNLLMSALRRIAAHDLGSDAESDIKDLMRVLAVAGLEDLLADGALLDWDGIREFSQLVVDEVNAKR